MTKQFPPLTNHSFHASVTACVELVFLFIGIQTPFVTAWDLTQWFFFAPSPCSPPDQYFTDRQKWRHAVHGLLIPVIGVCFISAAVMH